MTDQPQTSSSELAVDAGAPRDVEETSVDAGSHSQRLTAQECTKYDNRTDDQRGEGTVENDDLKERIHALETALATQTATTAGMEATNAATTAGLQAAQAAAQAGTWAVMVAGSASLIVGTLLGMAIAKTKS